MLTAAASQKWLTLAEIAEGTGHHEASISAQLRHLRRGWNGRATFQALIVEKRPSGDRARGLWEYQVRRPEEVVN